MKNKNPKISVIIPVFNSEKYLEKALESILFQTFNDFEIICIDDGSTDNSLKICYKEAEKDTRIKVICQGNKGVSFARNKGIKAAKGDYIIFLDADDYYANDALEIMYNDAIKENVDAVFYNHFYDYDGKIINRIPRLKTGMYMFKDVSDSILDDGTLTGILFGSACGVIYKTKTIKSNSVNFNETLSFNEDGIFNIEFLSKSKNFIYNAERNLYGYRQYKTFRHVDLEKFKKKFKATGEYIENIISLFDNQTVQLKRRKLTIAFQLSLLLCQSMKYSFLKKNLKYLWNDFNLEYYKNFLDFSKINFYKKFLALLICTKQIIAFIYLIKYTYPLFMKIIRR